MPDFSQFIKHFNFHLPPPFREGAVGGVSGSSAINTNNSSPSLDAAGTAGHYDVATFTRICDSTWRVLSSSDAAVRDGSSRSNALASSTLVGPAHSSQGHMSITIGRMMVSTEDRWRLQAQMRREEARSGQTRKEYNKKVTRAIKITKGPSESSFPPGRGRPL